MLTHFIYVGLVGDGCDSVYSVPNAFSWKRAVFHLLTPVEALCSNFHHLKGNQYKNPLLTQIRLGRKGKLYEKVTESKKDEGRRCPRKDCSLYSTGLFICSYRYRVCVPLSVSNYVSTNTFLIER